MVGLRRELSRFENYATLIGVMVGAGIFVAIGEAGKDAGPSTFLAYLVLGPVTLLAALPYIVFHSTSLGNMTGGAYIHISRTFRRYFPAFLTTWLAWVTYIGVLSVLSLSVGNYLQAFIPGINPKIIATFCLTFFFGVNVLGVKNYGRWQSGMFLLLILSVGLLIIPGLFAIRMENFHPFMPQGVSGFIRSLTVLFFAYAGFEALSQSAGETISATRTIPKIFFRGILISMGVYVSISAITFGVLPYAEVIGSKMPVADAAQKFLPFGAKIVALGAISAFLTTINALMMVPSRILYMFANDHVAPKFFAYVSKRTGTPILSISINFALALALVWTSTISYLIGISLQALLILYFTECLALVCLPVLNKPLWQQVPNHLRKKWVTFGSGVSCLCFMSPPTIEKQGPFILSKDIYIIDFYSLL
jgi:APA family basic amino acid/polyamine antiporter